MKPTVYCDPAKFTLEVVAEMDDPGAYYSYDLLVVWKHKDGRVFYASDAGCSCPSPFEHITSLDDLGPPITKDNWDTFVKDTKEHCSYSRIDRQGIDLLSKEAADMRTKVAKLIGVEYP